MAIAMRNTCTTRLLFRGGLMFFFLGAKSVGDAKGSLAQYCRVVVVFMQRAMHHLAGA